MDYLRSKPIPKTNKNSKTSKNCKTVKIALAQSKETEEITPDQIDIATQIAEEDMQNRVLQATLDELSPNDLLFLKAMLDDADSSRPDDIEQRLHKPSAHVAVYRKRLLEQGVLVDLGRTKFAFALPGLREYLPSYLENNL